MFALRRGDRDAGVPPRAPRCRGPRPSLIVAGVLLPAATILATGRLVAIDRSTAAPTYTTLLRGVRLLGVLPEPVLEFLATSAVPVAVGARETILREGEHGDRFYVIESGTVDILGQVFGPGDSFGEIALLRDIPRTATATALTDVTLVALERDVFVTAVTGHGPTHATAQELVAARLGSFNPLLA